MEIEEVLIDIYLNEKYLIKMKKSLKTLLSELRNDLKNKISEDYYFMNNEKEIEEEKEILIGDIIKDNKIYIKSFSIIYIILNNKQIDKIIISKTKKLFRIEKID